VEECGPSSFFASFTLAFTLQLGKKHGKTSVKVRKPSVRLRKTSVSVEKFSPSKKRKSEVDSASNRNEYREYFLGVKVAGAYG
jgi:hypothetical protein